MNLITTLGLADATRIADDASAAGRREAMAPLTVFD